MSEKKARIENVSDTALWVATYRAREGDRSDAKFKDPLAAVLAGERGREIARSMPYSKIMTWTMVIRTVAIDDLIKKSIWQGVTTILNLGAGLDTRPYRMELPQDLKWIEVDFPHVIELKNTKLSRETPRCQLQRIAMDLSDRSKRQNFFNDVRPRAGKLLVLTEGVIPYLTKEEVGSLADDLISAGFDYWVQDFYLGSYLKRAPKRWRNKLKSAPFKFVVENWFDFFAEHGWKICESIMASQKAKEISRPMPFPWRILVWMVPKKRRDKYFNMNGYVLLERV